MARPGVRRVMEIANLAASGFASLFSFGWGTGIYVLILEKRDCFCIPYSGNGDPFAWMLTAMPLKHGIMGKRLGAYMVAYERPGNL